MGYEAYEGSPVRDCKPDVGEASPFAGIGHAALILQFWERGADQTIGRELSLRLLSHADYEGDPTTEPLTGDDGRQILDDATGQPLTLEDYVNYATKHHPYAVEVILNFLHAERGEPEYERGKAAYARYVKENQS